MGATESKFKIGDRVVVDWFGDWDGPAIVAGFDGEYVLVKSDKAGAVGAFRPDRLTLATDSPIRTVTRREIVPGVYGRVIVERPCLENCASVLLVDRAGKRHNQINYLDADELREAAHIFNQIAEVLEENAKEAA